jgi:transcriptional regulator with XRE-family HTH domain
MKKTQTDYEALQAASDEARRLLRKEELILEVTEAITTAMAAQKLTKAQLARRLGKTPGFVTQILGGARNLTLATIADVCDALRQDVRIELVPSRRAAQLPPPDRGQQVVYFDFGQNQPWPTSELGPAPSMVCEEVERWGEGVG